MPQQESPGPADGADGTHGPDGLHWSHGSFASDPLRAAVVGHGLAELAWTPDGAAPRAPRAAVVVPLWHDGVPWVAATYADLATALEVAAAGEVVLSLCGAGTASAGAPSLLLRATARLEPDPTGERFATTLLDQELRRHPPSRALADSVLLRREHWWFVPRLLLRLDPAGPGAVQPLPAVTDPRAQGLLLTSPGPGRPDVRVVDRPAAGQPLLVPGAADAPALLLSHQATPDLERRSEHRVGGHVRDGRFVPVDDDGLEVPPLPGPLSLWARWRRQRDLQRACVAGLRQAGLH